MNAKKIQIIKKKVDISRLDGEYYKNLRYCINRQRNDAADILMIEFIPNIPITSKDILKTLLHLQREFTDILIAPKTHIFLDEMELEILTKRFNASLIMIGT